MFHHYKFLKERAVTFSLKYRIQRINQERFVFYPKNRRLIETIAIGDDENIGCELVNFKKSENGDLLVPDATSVKKVKENFEKPSLIASYSTVSEIVNEKTMYAMTNIKGTIFKLKKIRVKGLQKS